MPQTVLHIKCCTWDHPQIFDIAATHVDYVWALVLITTAPYILGFLLNLRKMVLGKASSKRKKSKKAATHSLIKPLILVGTREQQIV